MPRCRFAKRQPTGVALRREPFRLFFPLAILTSIVGVSLWPLVYAGWLSYYPGEAHARLMIQGFVGGFALGFLGTAFPKMIGSPSLTWPELGALLVSYSACVIAHAFANIAAGDGCFLFTWIFMVSCLAIRVAFLRNDLPPPGFVLAGMGLVSGIVGTTMLLIGRIVVPSEFQRTLGHLLLYEGFILGPIIGIGSFLFPRFLLPNPFTEERPTWNRSALSALLVGLAVLGTYLAQASGYALVPPIVRAGIVSVYLIYQVALFQAGRGTGTLSFMLRTSVICLLLGILVSGVAPMFQIAVKHLLFVGGYGLLILAIASRVTWGHSGNIHLAEGKRHSLRYILGFVMFAMATRVIADFIPAIRVSHHIYAALCWVIAVGIWSWAVLRYIRLTDLAED